MLTNDNPFFHRGPIENHEFFFGRVQEIQRTLTMLRRKQSVSIVGPRHIGKTSLIYHVCDPQVQRQHNLTDKHILVNIDCQGWGKIDVPRFYQELWQETVWALQDLGHTKNQMGHVNSFSKFREAMLSVRKENLKLVLLFDEFDTISQNPNLDRDVFSNLRRLVPTVSYVTASQVSLPNLTYANSSVLSSPFFNYFTEIELGLLTPEEAMRMIQNSLKMADSENLFAETDLAFAHELGGYHPFFLQLACYYLFDYKIQNQELSFEDYHHIRQDFIKQARPHFYHTWKYLESEEQAAALRICRGKSRKVDERLRSRLCKKCVLHHNQAFSSAFTDFILQQERSHRRQPRAHILGASDSSLTWLHLSDWHQHGQEFGRRVVRDALLRDIGQRQEISPKLDRLDFIVFSGDVAYHGKSEEYVAAKDQLFEPLLDAAGISHDRLFIVPGNHDLEWDALELLQDDLIRKFTETDEVDKWLSDERWRHVLLGPMENYSQFIIDYLGKEIAGPEPAYSYVQQVNVGGTDISIIGLNSAWLSARNRDVSGKVNDMGFLILGRHQVYQALQKTKGDGLRIAVLHHPLSWLIPFDQLAVQELIGRECQFILHGHQHLPQVNILHGTMGDCVVIPAGASYSRDARTTAQYANGYNFVHLDFATGSGTVYLRRWSARRGRWIRDIDTYEDGVFSFVLPKGVAKQK